MNTSLLAPEPSSQPDHQCDVLVVGGGINGVGIARDLAGRGWRVLLCEQDDLASHTSSASTKLIHGGLRYLEYGEFGLVRKALMERERLLRSAPHIMRPLSFVLPHDPRTRPAWMIRLGLWLYDHLAPRDFLSGSASVDLSRSPWGEPLHPQWRKGFVYTDGWVDDARLVLLCALDATEHGAHILTRTRCDQVQAQGDGWRATLTRRDAFTQAPIQTLNVQARAVVNAAGPWAEHLLRQVMKVPTSPGANHLRLVKGSHIVVPRLFDHDHAYLLQGEDRRIVFAIPYEQDFTLVGTTDVDHPGDPGDVQVSDGEVRYLCAAMARYLRRPVSPDDVVWRFAGVRPLLDDAKGSAAAVTRDYRLQVEAHPAPWLTVWGGKLTTFRVLAEQAADQVGSLLGEPRAHWTSEALLPGGALPLGSDTNVGPCSPVKQMTDFQARLRQRHPWLDLGLALRWSRAYGSRVEVLLEGVTRREDLGVEVAPDLYEVELLYLLRHEWVQTADDVLWRRSKLGLRCSPAQQQAVADWLAAQASAA